ncbi:MAG: PAS domain S-box protein [Ideonella sp.]|nr:PAS domain S-box protein [Ideonella sp.]
MAKLGGWRLDLATGYAHHSEEARAIHELGPGEGFDLGGALAYYPAAAREQLRDALQACRERGEPFDLELPFVTARGRDRWVRACGEAVTDESGRIVALHGALQDITEQHQGELALAESRARLDAVVRVLPDLWVVFDADDRYVDVSDPGHPALSAPWSEKVGRHLAETIDPALARQMRAAADEARDTGQLRSYFYVMDTHQGGRRHFEGRSVPMDGGRWMILVRDVTEIVHLEHRFRTLTEVLPVGLFETDARGWSTYVNPAWQDLFGLHGTAGLGTGWASAVHPDDLERIRATWAKAVAEGGHFAQEFRVRRTDGVERRVTARSNPIRRVDGQVVGHVGSVVDVTQAHELDQARRGREVAEEAARRQAAFLSRLSHELRTPLNAIIGFTELLLMQQPAGTPAGPLGHVRDAGAHMLALVNDLLQLQQVQQGHLPMRAEPVDVLGVVQACTALLDPLVRRCDARVVVDVAPALSLSTDRRTLQQVLLNLASNALKYGRERGGEVTLRAAASDRWVRLEVRDDGPGMTREQQRRLFQPFERLGQERGGQPGSGLGLVITQQLVQMLGGRLAIDSAPGAGTRVTVMLPVEATGPSVAAPHPTAALPAIAGTPIEP